jgi:Tfp pilus assembly protein PilP
MAKSENKISVYSIMAASAWIKHVMKYAKENNIKFGDALKLAAPSYKPQGSTGPTSSSKKMRNTRGKGKKRGGRTFRKK